MRNYSTEMYTYNDKLYKQICLYYEQIQRDVEEAKETRKFLNSASYVPKSVGRGMVQH